MLAKRGWRALVMTIALGVLLATANSTGVNRAYASEVPASILPGSSSKTTDA